MKAAVFLFSFAALSLFIPAGAQAHGRDQGRYGGECREYTRTVPTKYGPRSVNGLACQMRGGAWEIVDEPNVQNEGRVFILRGSGPNNVVYVDRYGRREAGSSDYIDFDDNGYRRYPYYDDDYYDRPVRRHDDDRWRYGRYND